MTNTKNNVTIPLALIPNTYSVLMSVFPEVQQKNSSKNYKAMDILCAVAFLALFTKNQ